MLLVGVGCASGKAYERDLKSAHEELERVQRDHDALAKRVGALEERDEARELSTPAKGGTGVYRPAAPAAIHPQPLKIVKLEPGEPRAPIEEPPPMTTTDEETGPRPYLKIGPRGAVQETLPDELPPGERVRPTKARSSVLDPQANADYQAALAMVKARKTKQALDALAGFIVRYPDHPYVANAMYWRGECYAALGDHANAVAQLEGVLARFPASQKVPDALLKLGGSYKKLGNPAKARESFDRLRKESPQSDAAKKIPPEDAP